MDGEREIFYIQTDLYLNLAYLGDIKPEAFETIKAALFKDITRRLRDAGAEIRNAHYREDPPRAEIRSNRQSRPKMKKFLAALGIPEKK
jgi:hypothetical protein